MQQRCYASLCRDAACSVKNMNQYRKSPRAKWLEYNEGLYFITICTHRRVHYFGEIIDAEMHLSPIGKYLYEELENVSIHHPHINILQFVIMPNHLHAIVDVNNAARCVPTIDDRVTNRLKSSQRPLLSTFIGSLKSAITKYAHECKLEFAWQSRYHDHYIRGVEDMNHISQYIEGNVLHWEKDCFYL